MKSAFTYLLVPWLVLLMSTQIVAQPEAAEESRSRWLNKRTLDSSSYLFIEGDIFSTLPIDILLSYEVMNRFMYLSGTLGYQHTPWFGVGIQRTSTSSQSWEGGSGYATIGLTYRLKYNIFQFRAGVGFITNYYRDDEACTYDINLDYNPHYSAWAGVILKNVFRLGVQFEYAPETIDARVTCFPWDNIRKSVKDRKLGAAPSFVPTLGLSVPFIRFARKDKN